MHRSGLAARASARLAVQLSHHSAKIASLCEIERMRAIGAEYDIGALQSRANADGHCLLTDREMNRALDLVRRVEFYDPLLDGPDAVALAVELLGAGHSAFTRNHLNGHRQ